MKIELFNALLQKLHQNELTKLSLGKLDELDKEQIKLLTEALRINSSVKIIGVTADQYLWDIEGKALFEIILEKIHHNELAELFLQVRLDTEKLESFAKVLMTNSSLTKLTLSDGALNTSMLLIADAIKHHKTLLAVNLDSNHIGEANAVFLSEILKENRILKSLSLQNNGFREKGIKCIAETALHNNQSLVSLNLHDNSGAHDLVALVDKVLNARKNQYNLGFLGGNNQVEKQKLPQGHVIDRSFSITKRI